MQSGPRWSLGERPALDGLRGIAVLLVVVGHMGVESLNGAGGVGVTMFFALSGFLITVLLLEERARHGRISLRHFYVRRALRLLPALVLFLAAMGMLALVSDRRTVPSGTELLGSLLYVGNYTTAMQGHDNVILHTWSLAVEEQFYLVWPLVVILVLSARHGRTKVLAAVAGAGCVAAIALRGLLWDDGAGHARIYYGTDTRLDCLLLGALAAIWLHRRPPGRNLLSAATGALIAAALLSLGDGAVEFLLVPFLVPLLTVVVILSVVQSRDADLLASRPLVLIGRRSYGIYLWHFPLVGGAAALPSSVRWPAMAVALVLTFAIVHLSWRCVEEPFLALKSRWGSPMDGRVGTSEPNSSRDDVTLGPRASKV